MQRYFPRLAVGGGNGGGGSGGGLARTGGYDGRGGDMLMCVGCLDQTHLASTFP